MNATNFNPNKQHTLANPVSVNGTGLHTGINVNMKLIPADHGFGIQFKRVDIPHANLIKADCDLVVDTSRGTTLEYEGARINTVEHILAALTGMGVDNVLVEVDGPEIPIIDGSSLPFVNLIEKAGVTEQNANKTWYHIDENLVLQDTEKRVEIVALPCDSYEITTLIDFNSAVLGTQYAKLKNLADFKTEIAPCRTFCFLHELEMLLKNDLIKGGDINNAIVVVDKAVSDEEMTKLAKLFNRDKIEVKSEGYLNNLELRFPNEPARHKLLDVVGDLTLVGYPIKTKIIANRPGHTSNVNFAKKIKQYIKKHRQTLNVPIYDPNQNPVFTSEDIKSILPHRYPMLLVDKIVEMTPTSILGIKNVTFNEWFFKGHFPDMPIMPGVLQVEALAQTGGILAIKLLSPKKGYDTYFLKIENCKFKHRVVPGDTMLLKMEFLSPPRRGIFEMKGTVYVSGKVCTEADLVAQVVERNS
ncbi:MAG: bifunctional UDP-3-O-[3-hydroxymyristoyl] N-acetylglucosamine deacetylase/3-hydroxyacyl-ACP dehydratase [Phycisphaerales bacterium]|nr:bifunctional UDP-3-O-[3-hydroxymyristoyl] N-acetylglucosamine deacetylase/3-hydroxyacyl-ACP dehydratase [Phycisphaerales bacterium]